MRWSNSDPITGQAAWYDLKVSIRKAEKGAGTSEPNFDEQKSTVTPGDSQLRYGQEW